MDSNDITRRRVISTLGAAGAVGLAGCGGGGGGDGTTTEGGSVDSVRIGMVQPLSGALQSYGTIAMQGFYGYFGYENGADAIPSEISEEEVTFEVDGTEYTIDVRDSGGNRSEAQSLANDMAGDVTALAGATSSASAIAIATNVANRQGIPYMAGPAASVSLTGDSDNCSRAVFRASETVAMDAQSGGRYVANETDIESVYIYYADYSFGQSVKDNYQRVLEENGVTVSGTQPLPQGYSEDWPGQLQKASNANVDAIIGGFTVATLPSMLGAYLAGGYDFRFVGGWGTRIAGNALGSILGNAIDGELTRESIAETGLGPLTTRYHWNQYDNDINSEFVDVHRQAYGVNPDLFSSGMFTAASSIVQAVQEAGSAEPEDIVGALRGMSVDVTPKGEGGYEFQSYNNQARSAMTVADPVPTASESSEYWPAAIQPSDPIAKYNKGQTTKSSDLVSCSIGN